MARRRDPNFLTGHLCRFCGQLVPWGTILRLIGVEPDTPGYMLNYGVNYAITVTGNYGAITVTVQLR